MEFETEIRYGYRVVETYVDDDGLNKSSVCTHDVGPGHSNQKFAERKVEWVNDNCSGEASVVRRLVTYSDWEEL